MLERFNRDRERYHAAATRPVERTIVTGARVARMRDSRVAVEDDVAKNMFCDMYDEIGAILGEQGEQSSKAPLAATVYAVRKVFDPEDPRLVSPREVYQTTGLEKTLMFGDEARKVTLFGASNQKARKSEPRYFVNVDGLAGQIELTKSQGGIRWNDVNVRGRSGVTRDSAATIVDAYLVRGILDAIHSGEDNVNINFPGSLMMQMEQSRSR